MNEHEDIRGGGRKVYVRWR